MLQENILKRDSTSEEKIVRGYQTLAGEFCVVNGEFSNVQYLINILLDKSTHHIKLLLIC